MHIFLNKAFNFFKTEANLFLFIFFIFNFQLFPSDNIVDLNENIKKNITNEWEHFYNYSETSGGFTTTYRKLVTDFDALITYKFFPLSNNNDDFGYFSFTASLKKRFVDYFGEIDSLKFLNNEINLKKEKFNFDLSNNDIFIKLVNNLAKTKVSMDSINVNSIYSSYTARIFGITFLTMGACSIVPGICLAGIYYQFLSYKGEIEKFKNYTYYGAIGIACIVTGGFFALLGLIFEIVDGALFIPGAVYKSYEKKYNKNKNEIIKFLNQNLLLNGLNLNEDIKMKLSFDIGLNKKVGE